MTEFIGGAVKTLIVEKDDTFAARWERILKQFPGATTIRVKTAEEAVETIENSIVGDIEQVCVCGEVYTPTQALPGLRTIVAQRKQEQTTA